MSSLMPSSTACGQMSWLSHCSCLLICIAAEGVLAVSRVSFLSPYLSTVLMQHRLRSFPSDDYPRLLYSVLRSRISEVSHSPPSRAVCVAPRSCVSFLYLMPSGSCPTQRTAGEHLIPAFTLNDGRVRSRRGSHAAFPHDGPARMRRAAASM
ncbi:hypothetical protein BD309DRAFT_645607 [Dichomitus squalens]|nr:hypothetical protein BD309DRAFT_645607 [Dichomitus squalens]